MGYDGAGIFTRSYNWVQDRDNSIPIRADRHDGQDDEFALAFNMVLLRNGVAPMSGDLRMGDNRISGLADGTAGVPALQFEGDPTTGLFAPVDGALSITAGGVERARAHGNGFSATTKFGIATNTPRTALDVNGISSFKGAFEDCAVDTANAPTGAINLDYYNNAVFVYTLNATANFTFNIRGKSDTTLNSLMAVGQMLTLAVEVPQGATAYYCTDITVDGAEPAQTLWQGGAPTAGFISSVNTYLIRVLKTADATFFVRASLSQERT